MRDKKPWADEFGNMCSYTHLQAKMRDYRLQHYQHYPDHCDIACAMLESEPDMRLNCQQVLRRLEKNCMCADSRQQRRKEVKQKAAATLGSSHDPNQQLVEDFIANPNIPLLLENRKNIYRLILYCILYVIFQYLIECLYKFFSKFVLAVDSM